MEQFATLSDATLNRTTVQLRYMYDFCKCM